MEWFLYFYFLTCPGNNIPVGIAVARQRVQEIVASPSLNPTGLLTTVSTAAHIKDVPRISEIGK